LRADTPDGREATAQSLRIGRYRVDAVLGTGAFATVYRAVDERLDDTVAVKVLAENHSLDANLRERFLTEGRVLRRIASPHVVSVHDLGETDRQQPYLVLEYADRGTLGRRVPDLLARGWRPGVADVWAVAEPLANALTAVHRAGVVHRDLNPTNVLITTRGSHGHGRPTAVTAWDERLVLADLGLCKDLALNSGHTSAGGTEGFRPPELRRGPAVIDGRADLWSLSALVVWLVTGAPPGDVLATVALRASGLPMRFAWALDRSLAVDPAARHPDPQAWLADVAAALGEPAGAVDAAVPPPPPPPTDTAGMTGVAGMTGASVVDRRTVAPPGSSPGAPVDASPPPAPRSWGWRLRHSAWMLAALPAGLTTWAGFLYIGLRAGRRSWLRAAAGYGAAAVVICVLAVLSPVQPDGQVDMGAWQSIVGSTVMAATWIGGGAHAVVADRTWLRWRSRHPG
jgi:serine/threonine protein kinase